jgi:hypothetical protein
VADSQRPALQAPTPQLLAALEKADVLDRFGVGEVSGGE